jgi:hypothetical protein
LQIEGQLRDGFLDLQATIVIGSSSRCCANAADATSPVAVATPEIAMVEIL